MKKLLLAAATFTLALLVTAAPDAQGQPGGKGKGAGRAPRVAPGKARRAARFTYCYWNQAYRCYLLWAPSAGAWYYYYPATRSFQPYSRIATNPPPPNVMPPLPNGLPRRLAGKGRKAKAPR